MTEIVGPDQLERCVELLNAGHVIGVPTDTVYGIAASLQHPNAIEQIYAIKGRPEIKPIPILVADVAAAEAVAESFPAQARIAAEAHWPGALTVVVPAGRVVPAEALAGGTTVGVRMPDHPLMLDLLCACGGALAVTSANRSGELPAITAGEVQSALHGRIPIVLDGGVAPGGSASTVAEFSGGSVIVHREGPIPAAELEPASASGFEPTPAAFQISSKSVDAVLTLVPLLLTILWGALLRGTEVDPTGFPIVSGASRGLYMLAITLSAFAFVARIDSMDWPVPSWRQITGTSLATLGSLIAVMQFHDWQEIVLFALLAAIGATSVTREAGAMLSGRLHEMAMQAVPIVLSSGVLISMIYGFRARTVVGGTATAIIAILWFVALQTSREDVLKRLPSIFVAAVLTLELHWVMDHWPSSRWAGGAILSLALGALIATLQIRSRRGEQEMELGERHEPDREFSR